jgi:hypothetical protein
MFDCSRVLSRIVERCVGADSKRPEILHAREVHITVARQGLKRPFRGLEQNYAQEAARMASK